MKVAACQLHEIVGDLPRALSEIKTHTADAERRGVQLVCFPECYLQGYFVNIEHVAKVALVINSTDFDRILYYLAELRPTIVLGLIERDGNRFFNTAVVIERGVLIGVYRKKHLLKSEHSIFEPGDRDPIVDVGGIGVGIAICHDLSFPDSVDVPASGGAKLVASPCNNMLCRVTAEHWKDRHHEIRSQRARESGLWLISSDVAGETPSKISYGPTSIIDPSGTIVAQVPLLTPGIVVAEMPSRHAQE